jgi:4-amino-4-deoxy-L-arabinose transferase-like glycosyltransferase
MLTFSLLVISTGMMVVNFTPLFDWDEINFAESGREMLVSGNWVQPQINYLPFHEKPPLFIWMELFCFKTFGVSALSARLPNILCGLVTGILLWRKGEKWGVTQGILWSVFLGLSVLPQLYFRSGIIDPWFNLFILLGLWPSLKGDLGYREVLIGGFWLGLAVMTKGPAAGLIAGLCWLSLLALRPNARLRRASQYLLTGLLALVPIAIWLFFLWQQDDGFFAREFITYQWRLFIKEDAGHGGFFGYHVVVLLLGCFPAGIFALPALLRRKTFNTDVDTGMRVLFWVVLILFSIVNTKIIHYSSLAYFPLAWFAARGITEGHLKKDWKKVRTSSLIVWGLYGVLALSLPIIAWNLSSLLPKIEDAEMVSRLSLEVNWPWFTLLPAIILTIGIGLLMKNRRAEPLHLAYAHLALSAIFVSTALVVFTPRIQRYSQGELIHFFESKANEDAYFGTAYHKSYAHWFYGEVKPEVYVEGCQERQCRFHEAITRPLYFSSPLRKTEQVLREVPDAELLYQKGGFSFYRRPATSSK